MPIVTTYLEQTWLLALDAAPWLLLGLVAAGLIHAFVSTAALSRFLGGPGLGPIVKAAFIGAPLPLCSCGVIPAAVALRRQGASPGATVSFLVSTPETGVDSVAISYALLGPFMMIIRPIGAIVSAIAAGLAASALPVKQGAGVIPAAAGCCSAEPVAVGGVAAMSCCGATEVAMSSCCSDGATTPNAEPRTSACCGDPEGSPVPEPRNPAAKFVAGLRYAATTLLDDLTLWLLIGILLAGAAATFLTPETLGTFGAGLPAMLLMLAVGIPMYICATASTPLAAGLLLAGVSPGAVLVFLLAGPATNVATLAILRREMGTPIMLGYLAAISVTALALGLLTDLLVSAMGLNILGQVAEAGEAVPYWLALASLILLVALAIRPLRRAVIGQ